MMKFIGQNAFLVNHHRQILITCYLDGSILLYMRLYVNTVGKLTRGERKEGNFVMTAQYFKTHRDFLWRFITKMVNIGYRPHDQTRLWKSTGKSTFTSLQMHENVFNYEIKNISVLI